MKKPVKRSKKDYAPHVEHSHAHRCEVPGCPEPGEYKAPKSKRDLHHYHYFCLEHVREHNKQWDYFAGMSEHEIEEFRKDAVTGHRPTWERGATIPNAQEKLYAAVNDFLHAGRRRTKAHPQVSAKISKALAIFEMDYPYTHPILKKNYKDLVKRYHPDRNHGDKLAEEKFKAIASAYKLLEAHLQES